MQLLWESIEQIEVRDCVVMIRIGIFGGSFDPLTVGHIAIIKKVIDSGLVDKLLVVPTIVDYHRLGKTKWMDDDMKVLFIKNILCAFDGFGHQVEINITELNYRKCHSPEVCAERRFFHTVYDLEWALGNESNNVELYTVVGTDSLANFKTWYRWEDVLKVTKLIGIRGRKGATSENEKLCTALLDIDPKYADISASAIRNKFSGGRPCDYETMRKYMKYLMEETVER